MRYYIPCIHIRTYISDIAAKGGTFSRHPVILTDLNLLSEKHETLIDISLTGL